MSSSAGSHQITQKDVTVWAAAALVCGALALVAGNLGGLLPASVAAQLHGTRLAAVNFQQMQAMLGQTRQEAAELALASRDLASRFDLMDRNAVDMARRVGAVERSLPLLVEALPLDNDVDRSLLTASIATDPEALVQVEGGLLALSRRPLFSQEVSGQPMPPPIDDPASQPYAMGEGEVLVGGTGIEALATGSIDPADSGSGARENPIERSALGLDLGVGSDADASRARWEDLLVSAGPLLLGLEARLAEHEDGVRLIAGPFPTRGAAETICERLVLIGTDCAVGVFEGEQL